MPPTPRSQPVRQYDRVFDWVYELPEPGPPRPRQPAFELIPVMWDGLPLNTGDQENGLCSVVENVEGWLDSPPLDGNDQARALADGSVWGPKTLGARFITISGAAAGPRELLGWLRDQLAARAANRAPVELSITDGGLQRTLSADVRAGTEHYRQTWICPTAFRWQVTVSAADPLLYGTAWEQVVLTEEAEDSGRRYQREYLWRYGHPWTPNSAVLANAGNWPAPVWALYEGDLTVSTLTDDEGGIIRLAQMPAEMHIRVATATLSAEAEGGLSRASFILPGSRPMLIPAGSAARWHLYAAGRGQVTLAWRHTWV